MTEHREPTVSVVIPMFNRAATVRASIASVLRQTYRALDVVVVDDGSTDDSVSVVRAIDDPRVRLLAATSNGGAAAARNLGVEHSTGEWVAFQDSDDEWLPCKLERQMELLVGRGRQAVAGFCGMVRVGEGPPSHGCRLAIDYVPDVSIGRVDGDLVAALLRWSFISTQTLVVRRAIFETVGGFDPATTPIEDWDLAIRLAVSGPIACVDEPLVVQRFSPDSITRQVERRVASQARVINKYLDVYQRDPEALARAYYTVAGGYRRLGELELASQFLAKARSARAHSAKTWTMSSYVAARRLAGRLPALIGRRG